MTKKKIAMEDFLRSLVVESPKATYEDANRAWMVGLEQRVHLSSILYKKTSLTSPGGARRFGVR